MTDPAQYAALVAAVGEEKPRLAQALALADQRRAQNLANLIDGARLSGLEQLFEYLEAARQAYASLPAVMDIAFLIERVRAGTTPDGVYREGASGHSEYPRPFTVDGTDQLRVTGYNTAAVIAGVPEMAVPR
ncbi:hypothetical protein L2K20_08185 [Mycobacterium sp. MBM]|nr:hypothetical protein [Mycobacterium sp. MBM]